MKRTDRWAKGFNTQLHFIVSKFSNQNVKFILKPKVNKIAVWLNFLAEPQEKLHSKTLKTSPVGLISKRNSPRELNNHEKTPITIRI